MSAINKSEDSESNLSSEGDTLGIKNRRNKNMIVISLALFLISTGWFTLAATGETITRIQFKNKKLFDILCP